MNGMSVWQTYYRPHNFSQLQLTSVRENMQALARTGRLSRVWLFTGPRGTGKTSTARILAAMLATAANQAAIENNFFQDQPAKLLPFADPDENDPEVQKIFSGDSYSVIELDAASHRGIDDVRQLQEQIFMPPTIGTMAVYILDEVHMFTTEAFNALLKTLEEPPKHCFFILATTEKQKVPPTVISRCSLLNFHQASSKELVTSFERILAAEKMTAAPDALTAIADLAEGSFRDGVKLLQTVADHGEINLAAVKKYLADDQEELVQELIKIILAKDEKAAVDFFARLRLQTTAEKFFIKNLFDFLYQELVANIKNEGQPLLSKSQTQFLLNQFLDLRFNSPLPYLDLELKVLQIFSKAKK